MKLGISDTLLEFFTYPTHNQPMIKKSQEQVGEKDSRAVQLKDVSFKPGGKMVLEGINLTIPTGTLFSLIGRTGSGKSTLLRMINRLSEPTTGNVTVLGKNINDWAVRELRRTACLIPQSYALPNISVEEILTYACKILGIKYDPDEIFELLAGVELPFEILSKKTHTLSGGERQRVAVCRTLLASPEILLADEPTANLDPASAHMIAKMLHNFSHNGKTVVWVTHDPLLAEKFTDCGALLHKGRMVAKGRLVELASREEYRI
jgi:ABC-type multidrug transport system ATPase subunit